MKKIIALICAAAALFTAGCGGSADTDGTGTTEPYIKIMKSTILVITPFILSSFILNLTTTLDQIVYLKMMINGRGLAEAAVTTVFGLFSNKAVVIINIPVSVATAVSAAIIPNISMAQASGDIAETRR